jgi:hypothetical protein
MADNKFKFGELKQNIERMKRDLPIILANDSMNYFVKSWDDQGWDGEAWQTPKRRIDGTPEYKYPKFRDLGRRTRATLVKTGTLRRAVSMSVRSQTFTSIRLVVDLPYAARHNEGLDGMPKRQFFGGNSPILMQQHKAKIMRFMDGLWGK